MKKIIFLDIDGTIRDFDGYIPDSTVKSVVRARKNGHKVCISTGRPLCQIEKRVMDIGFDGVISGSGTYVEYEGKCVLHKFIKQEVYLELCEYLLKNNCVIELQTAQESFILRSELHEFRAIGERIGKKLGNKAKELASMPVIMDDYRDIGKVEKILFFGNELSNEEIIKIWGNQFHIVPLSIPNSERYGGEITEADVNKAQGILSVLEASGYGRSDVIAIGDSENDLEMLELAAVGVSMGNGSSVIKRAADIVTTPLKEDGIKNAFLKLNLI